MSFFFFFKQKTAYEMRISDWSSDVCSSDLHTARQLTRLLRFVRPFRCFFKILDRHSGNLAAFLQRHVIGLYGPIKPRCMLLNKRIIYPPLFDHISKQPVKQSRVRTRLYRSEESRVGKDSVRKCKTGWQ